jgi:hypothetical protein
MAAISRALPAIQWHGAYGGYETPHFQIGIDLAGEAPLSKIWVNTNALKADEPSNPVSVLAQICKANGWSLMDCSTSRFIDLDRPSIEGWEMYVDLMKLVIADLTTGKPERRPTKKAKNAKKKPRQAASNLNITGRSPSLRAGASAPGTPEGPADPAAG